MIRRNLVVLVGAMVLAAALVPGMSAQALVVSDSPSVVWRPTSGITYAMVRVGGVVIIGGTFTSMTSPSGQTVSRSRLAAVDANDGSLLSWAPNPNGDVRSLAVSDDGQTVYVGGSFTSIGGSTRNGLAAVRISDAKATSFRADVTGTVYSLLMHDGDLLVGGAFSAVGGVGRGGGAEVDPVTGAVGAWNPRANNGIYAMEASADGTGVFIGGTLTTVNGSSRNRLAMVRRTNGDLLPWISGSSCQDATNPCTVYDIERSGDNLVVAMGGPGGRVVNLDAVSGGQRWWTGGDGDVQTVDIDANKVYAGGHFADGFGSATRAGLVALDLASGGVLPELTTSVLGSSGVWIVMRDGDVLRFAGHFATVNGLDIRRYSLLPIVPDPPDTTAPGPPGTPRAGAALEDLVSLTWSAATDNVAVTKYKVHRDGSHIATTDGLFFRDTNVVPGRTYSYRVSALDSVGNEGPLSSARSIGTEPAEPRLLARAASWDYLSTGNAPTGSWTSTTYTPSGWSRGVGEFGFGDGDEVTYISPLGVAHYFRTTFDVANLALVANPRLRLLIDDGAVIYLNGAEVARVNMPTGQIVNSTVASTNVGGSGETTYSDLALPIGALRAGQNTLAISAHNYALTSADVSMDAFIEYTANQTPQVPAQVTNLRSTGSTASSVSLAWDAVAGATSYTVMRGAATVGTATGTTFTESALEPDTGYTYTVRASNAAGDGPQSAPLTVSTKPLPQVPGQVVNLRTTGATSTTASLAWDGVTGADSYAVERDGVVVGAPSTAAFSDSGLVPGTSYTYRVAAVNAAGQGALSDPLAVTTSAQPVTQYVVPGGSWRINDTGADLGTSWRGAAFDDTGWKSGVTEFGYGDGDEATVISYGPSSTNKYLTTYARARFDAGASVSDVKSLRLRAVVDDGCVVYVNGVEVWRYNMPTGAITSSTRASTYVAGAAEKTWLEVSVPSASLVPGVNVVAVEVHNDSPSSSDLSWNLDLVPVR